MEKPDKKQNAARRKKYGAAQSEKVINRVLRETNLGAKLQAKGFLVPKK